MSMFLSDPVAVDFIAGQAWLSPTEPVSARPFTSRGRTSPPIGVAEAARQIGRILARTELFGRPRLAKRTTR